MNKSTPIIIGNWKMNMPSMSRREYINVLRSKLSDFHYQIVIAPPAIYLEELSNCVSDLSYQLSAQNISTKQKGSFTGEISAEMVREFASFVLLGHSERRVYHQETDEDVNRKLQVALRYDLTPVICIGEREKDLGTEDYFRQQLDVVLQDVSREQIEKVIIAYEPIWAISGFRDQDSEEIDWEIIHQRGQYIRQILDEKYPNSKIQLLYGGSINADNIKQVFDSGVYDGVVVGSASIDPFALSDICLQLENIFKTQAND